MPTRTARRHCYLISGWFEHAGLPSRYEIYNIQVLAPARVQTFSERLVAKMSFPESLGPNCIPSEQLAVS